MPCSPAIVSKEPLELLAKRSWPRPTRRAEKFEGGGSITGHLNCFPGRSARFVYDEVADHGIVDAI